MAKCDLCGDKCKASDMVQLRESYQVEGVDDICDSCRRWLDKELDALRAKVDPQLKAIIAQRKGRATKPPVPWWRRIAAPVGAKGDV